jgi:hypothetical protein
MNKRLTSLSCTLLIVVSTAFADANRHLNPPRVYTGVNQPHGKPTPASGFAPRPGRSGRHVYGAPIQKPILRSQPRKPTPAGPKLRTLPG